MKHILNFAVSLVITALLIYALNNRWGTTPPLGKFLDPVKGVWQTALIPDIPKPGDIQIPGLRDEVQVVYNERGVPHIFAKNDHDLYLAAGYVTAKHRLWQMEFSSHAAAGRISEIVGVAAIDYDRHQRRIGMKFGAERTFGRMMQDPESSEAVEAYSKGVNAWIDQLTHRTLPFEYKLLDYRPEPWDPIKSAYYYMNMNQTLTFGSSALQLSNLKAFLGEEAVRVLYPTIPPNNEPIISPTNRVLNPIKKNKPDVDFTPVITDTTITPLRDPGIGSNNWAVSGEKTASGSAMMSTDPHLTLSLPSIWYEIQFNAPGINAYGISLPGVPAIIMGFNESIAWGNTNTGGGSLDIFEVELNDDFSAYLHDGEWKPTRMQIEVFNIRGQKSRLDTIYFTHHGPIAYLNHEKAFANNTPAGHALRWIAHEPANPLLTFKYINRGTDFADFRKGLSYLSAPTQNYVFASVNGDIAMQLNGLHPVRFEDHGKFINDGRDASYDWDDFTPFEHLPMEINPPRNFVSSANQHPYDENYPYYFHWSFADMSRAKIINETLENLENATPRDFIDLLLNSDNYWAEQYLDRMLEYVQEYLQENSDLTKSVHFDEVFESLKTWNRVNTDTSTAARVFNHWQAKIVEVVWSDVFKALDNNPHMRPTLNITYELLFNGYASEIYQEIAEKALNTSEVLTLALNKTLEEIEQRHGTPSDRWQWWHVNGSTINHLLNISALSEPRLQVSGSSRSPSAINNRHGPSWRMVAEMTTPVQAWGAYPGGQTGNPASNGYNRFIGDWASGQLYPLHLYASPEAASAENHTTIVLKP